MSEQNSQNYQQLRVMCIGDPHLKVKNVNEYREMIERIHECLEEKQPDIVVVLGDILDTMSRISVFPLTDAIDWLREISIKYTLFLVIGNHDRPNNSDFLSRFSPFRACKYWPHTHVADTECLHVNIVGFSLIFAPYVPPGRLREALDSKPQMRWKEAHAIFAHQEFEGAKMGAIHSEVGDQWGPTDPLIISGHIHDYQRLADNCIYTGTPMQHSFDGTLDKTISLFTLYKTPEDLKESIEKMHIPKLSLFNSSVDYLYAEERIELGLKRRKIFRIPVEDMETFTIDPKKWSGIMIKVVIRGGESKRIPTLACLKVVEWKERGYKVDYKVTLDESSPILIQINRGKELVSFRQKLEERLIFDKAKLDIYREIFIDETEVNSDPLESGGSDTEIIDLDDL